jgi:hypothetical protein
MISMKRKITKVNMMVNNMTAKEMLRRNLRVKKRKMDRKKIM